MPNRVRTSSSPPSGREPRGERRLERTDAFRASMPVEYRNTFDEAATREHAAIVERRAGAPVHVETWRQLPSGGAIVCIVADDRPGLLSLISASLTAARMDILSMQAYTRTHPEAEVPETVDFVWLRREGDASPPIGSAADGYWAHLAGVRVVVEVPLWGRPSFWASDARSQSEVLADFAEAGARIVVSDQRPPMISSEGWHEIGATGYFLHPVASKQESK